MPNLKTLQRSFNGGELAPAMLGRLDDGRYQNGCRRMLNFIALPQGPAQSRPGTKFVRRCRSDATKARLIPFRYGLGQAFVLELGLRSEYPATSAVPCYLRFHTGGATVVAGNAWSASTAYAQHDIARSGGTLYRCIVAHTNHVPPNTTYWKSHEWVASRPFNPADVNTGTEEITFAVAHGLVTADPIIFTSDNAVAIPAPLVEGATYYAIVVSATVIKVAATASQAAAGTAINLTSQGGVGGQHRCNYAYVLANLVSFGGTIYYCRQSPVASGSASVTPGADEAFWYALPATFEYELPVPMALSESELFALTYAQLGDTLTLASESNRPHELVRGGANIWTCQPITFGSALSAPTGVAVTPTYGQVVKITEVLGLSLGFNPLKSLGGTPTGLVVGDYVKVSGVPGITASPDSVYVVADDRTIDVVYLKTADTGAIVTATVGVVTGTIRRQDPSYLASNSYKVTAVDVDGIESAPSSAVTAADNNLSVDGSLNTVTWNAVSGAVRYRVYKKQDGLYGLIGETEELTFRDGSPESAPNMGETAPLADATLAAGSTSYPRAVCQFEGRRGFGGTTGAPQDLWLTRANTQKDLAYHLPLTDRDRIHERIAAVELCAIRHLVPLGHLIVLSDSAEFRVTPLNSDALTPASFSARAQSYIGSSAVQPVVCDTSLLFVAARGGHVQEFRYQVDSGGFTPDDLSIRAGHLFDGLGVTQMAYGRAPLPIVWAVSSGGSLLGCTYVPRQDVSGWHQHTTAGMFESCCVIPDGTEDRLYVEVLRVIGGTPRRFVERLDPLSLPTAIADAYCVDCGATYSGAPTSTITGLDHLEGATVAVLADGVVQPAKTVASGQITLGAAASKVHVGLAYVAELRPVSPAMQVEALGDGRQKNLNQVWLRTIGSAGFQAGPSDVLLATYAAAALESRVLTLKPLGAWRDDVDVILRQSNPLPLNVVSMTIEFAVGGG